MAALTLCVFSQFANAAPSWSQVCAPACEISADNNSAEPGQLSFEWFIDGNDVHIYERYRD